MEVSGKLLFHYTHYYTVDEEGLPSHSGGDGDHDFELQSVCCVVMNRFINEYNRDLEITTHVYPDLMLAGNHFNLILKTVTGEFDDESEIEIPCCPWCRTKPIIIKIKTIKKIKRCKIETIPEQKRETCEIETIEE